MRDPGILLAVLIFLVLLSLGEIEVSSAVSESDAASRIEEAEAAVNSAYFKVLEVEQKGADISVLLARLNAGAENLSEAQMLFKTGDFGGAVSYADLAVQSVEGVIGEAEQLEVLAGDQYREKSFLTVATSFVAVVAIILEDAVCWQLFKKRYFEKLLKMEPEEVEA